MKTTYTPPQSVLKNVKTTEAMPADFPLPRLHQECPKDKAEIALFFSEGKYLGWVPEVTANAYRFRLNKIYSSYKRKYSSHWTGAVTSYGKDCLYVVNHTVEAGELLEENEALEAIEKAIAAGRPLNFVLTEFDTEDKYADTATAYQQGITEKWNNSLREEWDVKIKDAETQLEQMRQQMRKAFAVVQKEVGETAWRMKDQWDWAANV